MVDLYSLHYCKRNKNLKKINIEVIIQAKSLWYHQCPISMHLKCPWNVQGICLWLSQIVSGLNQILIKWHEYAFLYSIVLQLSLLASYAVTLILPRKFVSIGALTRARKIANLVTIRHARGLEQHLAEISLSRHMFLWIYVMRFERQIILYPSYQWQSAPQRLTGYIKLNFCSTSDAHTTVVKLQIFWS